MNVSTSDEQRIRTCLDDTFSTLERIIKAEPPQMRQREVGIVHFVGHGIVRVGGLPNVRSEEIVRFPGDVLGYVFNIDPDEIGVILLGRAEHLTAGSEVRRTGRVMDVPVGDDLLGRVVDAMGRPLDNLGEIRALRRLPVEREAPPVMARDPVTVPLQTGLKVSTPSSPLGGDSGNSSSGTGRRAKRPSPWTPSSISRTRTSSASIAPSARRPRMWPRSSPTSGNTMPCPIPSWWRPREKTHRDCSSSPLMPQRPWGNTSCRTGTGRPHHLRRSDLPCPSLPGAVPAAAAARRAARPSRGHLLHPFTAAGALHPSARRHGAAVP